MCVRLCLCFYVCLCVCVSVCVLDPYRFVAEAKPQEVQRYDSVEALVQSAPDLPQNNMKSFRMMRIYDITYSIIKRLHKEDPHH